MATSGSLLNGVAFDHTAGSVYIYDSPRRVFFSVMFLSLIGFVLAPLFSWIGYKQIAGMEPYIRHAAAGLILGPLAFLVCLYFTAFLLFRYFDDEADIVLDRDGITDRWLGCGHVPWGEVDTVSWWSFTLFGQKNETPLLYVQNSRAWLKRCFWPVRLMHGLNRLCRIPPSTLPFPSAENGCPIDRLVLLWLVAQYKPSSVIELIEIDLLDEKIIQGPPVLAAEAMRTLYGSGAEQIVDKRVGQADHVRAAKWHQVREELNRLH